MAKPKPPTENATKPAAVYVDPKVLKPWGKNPRKNDGRPVAAVAKSLQRFGFAAPIVANKNGEVIAGHTRLKAALKLGLTSVPVRYVDLSETEAHALAVADNKLGELAEWDDELLREVLREATAGGDVTQDIGFSEKELRALLDPNGDALSTDGDDDVELQNGRANSKRGVMYELGPHLLWCGDSRARPEHGDGAKLQIADPPFDVPYGQWRVLPTVDVVAIWFRSKDAMAWMLSEMGGEEWGMHMFVFTGGVRGQHNHTLPCCMHENVAVLRKTWWTDKFDAIDRGVIRASGCKATKDPDSRPFSWQEKSGGVLAAQSIGMSWAKPIMQFEILIAYVPKGSIVWDPCAGSGSSLIASAKHGRIWRGCELEPRHADLIRRRWTKVARQNGIEPGSGALE